MQHLLGLALAGSCRSLLPIPFLRQAPLVRVGVMVIIMQPRPADAASDL